MNQRKPSVPVPSSLARFVEKDRTAHGLKTKSGVVERALKLSREQELERDHARAAQETDSAWEATVGDGLNGEEWS